MPKLSSSPGGTDADDGRVRRLWEAVQQTSHEVVWELHPSGTLQSVNGAARDILGADPADLVGRSVLSVVHPDDVPGAADILAWCVEAKTGWHGVRVRVLRPDGQTPWIETSGVAHVGPAGELLGFTATTRRLDADDAREASLAVVRARVDAVLAQRRLRTVWQPIFSLDTGVIAGVEALTRFDGPAAPPDRWFADAFSVGRGVELEVLAVEEALTSAGRLPPGVHLSFNVSPDTVASGRLPALVAGCGIPPERLVIELTEHVSIDNYDAVAAEMAKVRRSGVRLAVDDAGAGFASFRHILRLRPDIIKLDQSITRGITADPAQRALATALVLFAMELGDMSITAEGVESEDDLRTVMSLGVDGAQGYHMAVPTPLEAVDWGRTVAPAWTVHPAAR